MSLIHANGDDYVAHPLIFAGVVLAATSAGLAQGHTDYIGIAALIAAITSLVGTVLGVTVTLVKLILDYRENKNSNRPTTRRRRGP